MNSKTSPVRTNYESTSPNKRFDTSPNHKRYDASPSTSKEYASKPLSESNIDKQTNSNHNTRDPREFSSKDQSTIVHVRRDSFSHSETNYFIPVSGTLQYHSENEQPPSLPPRDGDYTQNQTLELPVRNASFDQSTKNILSLFPDSFHHEGKDSTDTSIDVIPKKTTKSHDLYLPMPPRSKEVPLITPHFKNKQSISEVRESNYNSSRYQNSNYNSSRSASIDENQNPHIQALIRNHEAHIEQPQHPFSNGDWQRRPFESRNSFTRNDSLAQTNTSTEFKFINTTEDLNQSKSEYVNSESKVQDGLMDTIDRNIKLLEDSIMNLDANLMSNAKPVIQKTIETEPSGKLNSRRSESKSNADYLKVSHLSNIFNPNPILEEPKPELIPESPKPKKGDIEKISKTMTDKKSI